MRKGRGFPVIRSHHIAWRLKDGRPKQLQDFDDIKRDFNVTYKTIYRDLDFLMEIPEYQIIRTEREGRIWWTMKGNPPPTKIQRTEKQCSKCPGLQPIENFGRSESSPDGHAHTCRRCRTNQYNSWRSANKERVNQKQRRNYRKRKRRDDG